MTTRRQVLSGIAAAAILPGRSWASVGSPVAVSAAKRPDGRFVLVGLDARGLITFEIPLPARGHAAAAHPDLAEVVAIARRPGSFAKVIDCIQGRERLRLEAPAGRHFCGHAAFSSDGAYLFTAENNYAEGAGQIGVWDRTKDYARLGAFSSGGIGPHEIIRMPDGNFAVANGGILTHPNSGRTKLNLDTMRSNLSIISPTGDMIDQAHVPEDQHLNSLRHIAAQPDGTVGCGLQWQGDLYESPSLVAFYTGQSTLEFAKMDLALPRQLKGYIGSVGCLQGNAFAVSSPRGGRVIVYGPRRDVLSTQRAVDVCGVASVAGHTSLVTSGLGEVFELTKEQFSKLKRHDLSFDNHLVSL